MLFVVGSFLWEKVRRQIDGHGEDDGGVVLGGDAVQRLKIAQLKQRQNKVKISLIARDAFFSIGGAAACKWGANV